MTVLAVCASALLLWSGWRIAAVLRLDGAAERLTAAVLLWIVGETGLVLAAGFARQLVAWVLLVETLVIAVLSWLLTRRPVLAPRRAAARAEVRSAAGEAVAMIRRSRLLQMFAGLVALEYVWRLLIAVRLPALDWDGLWYHLTIIDVWHQAHAITSAPQVVWGSFPADSEAAATFACTIAGATAPAHFVQFAFALLLALTVLSMCRRAGLSGSGSLLAGLVAVMTPTVFIHTPTVHVDLAEGADVLVGWHFVLAAFRVRGRPRFSATHLLLGSLGLGLAIGTKVSGLLPAGYLGVLAAVMVVRRVRSATTSRRAGLLSSAAAGTAVFALGGCWYLRNLVVHSNPFWPAGYLGFPGVSGATNFIAASSGATERFLANKSRLTGLGLSWFDDFSWHQYSYGHVLGGFGAQLLILLPATIAAIIARRRIDRWTTFGFLVPALLLLLVYPKDWQARYVLFMAGVFAVGLAVWLETAPRRLRATASVVLLGTTAFSTASATLIPNYVLDAINTRPPTIGEQWSLLWASPSTRADAGYGGPAYTPAVNELADHTRVCLPANVRHVFRQTILLHPLVGPNFNRELVSLMQNPRNADAAAALMAARGCTYWVAYRFSRIGHRFHRHPAPMQYLGHVFYAGDLYATRSVTVARAMSGG